tara:strand:+ start:48 stop:545 length:498 start_codon:yes stop_codon:yes gene_type:complete
VDSIQPKTTGGVINAKGMVIQVKNFQTSAVDTTTSTIPHDDTIPQNTEGKEFMSLAITPTSSTSKLLITMTVLGSMTSASYIVAALFKDNDANALTASNTDIRAANYPTTLTFSHYMEAGTTNEITFKVRAGADSAATFTINGVNGARRFGGVAPSSITITEIGA